MIRQTPEISDEKGYVAVRDTYQTERYDEVYAVLLRRRRQRTMGHRRRCRHPQDGLPTEQMAHVAAKNIAGQIRGELPQAHKEFGDIPRVCVMDAGNNGVLILADKMLPPRKHGVLIPGPRSHAMKLAFEKYFLRKARQGYVMLP
jgi:sulfide:quinone oxidoreductase